MLKWLRKKFSHVRSFQRTWTVRTSKDHHFKTKLHQLQVCTPSWGPWGWRQAGNFTSRYGVTLQRTWILMTVLPASAIESYSTPSVTRGSMACNLRTKLHNLALWVSFTFVWPWDASVSNLRLYDFGYISWLSPTNGKWRRKACYLLEEIINQLKAESHIACRAHAAPMPFPCHAVPLRV